MNENADEYSLQLENEKYYYRRIDSDSFFLRKELYGYKGLESVDVTASRTIVGTGRLKGGSLVFITDAGRIEIEEGLFGMYIPCFSIYRCSGDFESLELSFMISSEEKYSGVSPEAALFPSQVESFTGSAQQSMRLLEAFSNRFPVNPRGGQDKTAVAARQMIEAEYEDLTGVADIAERLELESWELSRVFKESYGIGPLKYLNNLRTIEAIYRILDSGKNKKIIDIAFNVGFRDLSRFNKQFRKFHRFIPKNLHPKK
jgi:AraC-like DNA-binding protein